ncbi:MAG: lysophospholipid acyltransferase family protein [Chloroflexota bacterium]
MQHRDRAAAHQHAAMTIHVSDDYAQRQERYDASRRFLRDVLLRPLGFHLLVKINEQGIENIPAAGPTLLMMNHIGAIDPAIIAGVARPRFAIPMSKAENFRILGVRQLAQWWGVFPIQRGEADRVALQNTIDLLKYGNMVLMAPEGTRQPSLIEGKDGITYVAIKANAVIVPVGLDGSRDFVQNLKHLRRTPVSVKFGRAFRFRTNGQERVPRPVMAHMTQEAMYQLAALLPEYRRGFYSDLSQATTETIEFV